MYGIDKNADMSFFLGVTLLQICVGESELILNLTSDTSVMIASRIGVSTVAGSLSQASDAREAAPLVFPLLGSTVLAAEPSEDGTLALTFDGGVTLTIYDSWAEFESYTVTHGDRMLVV